MKQRFSSLDVKVIAHELNASLVSLRLSNIYDLSSKILLLKFAKPENKKQLLIDSGFRCHLTDFARTTAAAPSIFVQKLRKVLKTRRLSAVSQIGTDRILEFQFSDGQYRLYLEFFASGNVILTDAELNILTLLRNVPEGEGQEPQRPGLKYSLENRQNYGGVPELTKERVRNALSTTVGKAKASAAGGKKFKKKAGDELRKGLATTIVEFPPILVDHAMKVVGFDGSAQPTAILENEELLEHLFRALQEAKKLVGEITSAETTKGYIFAKKTPIAPADDKDAPEDGEQSKSFRLLYDDFHPFSPQQFGGDPDSAVVTFDNFNKTVDEFFSSIEGQKLESKLSEREAAAKKKLDAAKQDQAKRIEGLQDAQTLNVRKANAIEANVERVEEAMEAVNGLLAQGMDWVNIDRLIDRERRRGNPVAMTIKSLNLGESIITLLLGEAEAEEEDESYETDSENEEEDEAEDDEGGQAPAATDTRLTIDINLTVSPWVNAREYYDEKKTAAAKEQKTVQQSEKALKSAEQKIAIELRKGLKQEKPLLQPIRKQFWFEKFTWFISSDGYLVLGGKDASQNEMLYRRYLKKGDIYVHADLHGAPSVIIKNNPQTPEAPIPPSTLSQAGSLSVCASSAWDSKAGMSAYWVSSDQVSKSAPTGEFLPTGSFMVRGKKNFLPPTPLILGFGVIFRVSEESKARHLKHRVHDSGVPVAKSAGELAAIGDDGAPEPAGIDEANGPEDEEDEQQGEEEDHEQRANPLQSSGPGQDDEEEEEDPEEDGDGEAETPAEAVRDLKISENSEATGSTAQHPEETRQEDPVDEDEVDEASEQAEPSSSASTAGRPQPQAQAQKKQPAKRGQKSKAKKIAAKYRDQDDEDRAAIEELIGATAGQRRAAEEARIKAEKEAASNAARERRKAQHAKQQRETAEHEEVRRLMLEEGLETLDASEAEQITDLESAGLVGRPLPGDEILEAIPLCGPYAALGSALKYKTKLQPGSQKKGKAVREILEVWRRAADKKHVVDERAQDVERMWPREVELIKALKAEEVVNVVPVRQLRVMIAGGATGGGSGGGGGKGGGKGGRGGKGKKK